jgi:thiol-disulfide isomerase/thioredoxin
VKGVLNKTGIITLGVVLVLVLTVGGVAYYSNLRGETTGERRHVPGLSDIQGETALPYTDLQGVPFDLTELLGKPIVINAFASWSPLSVDELRMLSRIQNEYRENIVVVAINRMEPSYKVASFIEAVGDIKGITFLLDSGDVFYKSIGGYAMPETAFYSKDGDRTFHKRGVLSENEIRTEIETLLQ